ncbi:MAG: radical SAM protein [Candidatus Latescibacteria bacterium]|jgi:radical SAM superfamily enzyme YgiQ (UPF0313 family)|nr:radical SAM protein [Candidatus Latescibacterota bacterium]
MKLSLVSLTREEATPPISLGYLAAALNRDLPEVEVDIIDGNYGSLMGSIKRSRPDVVGISAMTVHYNQARRVAELVKTKLGLPVILGGVHISTHTKSFDRCFDVGVIGEGELTLVELLGSYLSNGRRFDPQSLREVQGLIYWEDGNPVQTPPRPLIGDMDSISRPDWSLFNPRYTRPAQSIFLERVKAVQVSLLSARGCPYKCIFCSTSKHWHRVRFYSANYVADEIEYLIRTLDADIISFWDDLFTINKSRLAEIADELERRGLLGTVKFCVLGRMETMDEEVCRILKKMGVININFGFESGSDRILKYLKKHKKISVDHAKNAVRLCNQFGFSVSGSFMMGSPGEKREDLMKTVELIDWMASQPSVFDLWLFTTSPLPNTELWDLGIEKGLIDEEDYDFDFSSQYSQYPLFLDESIPLSDFQEIYQLAESKMAGISPFKKTSYKIGRALRDPRILLPAIKRRLFVYNKLSFMIKKRQKGSLGHTRQAN